MPRTVLLRDWLDRHLARSHTEEELKDGYSLEPASADASFRRYFRVTLPSGDIRIVMDAPPELEDCRPFLQVAALFRDAGVHVPEVFDTDLAQGFLLLSDLGRETYLDVLNEDNARELMDRATTALVAWQKISRPNVLPAYSREVLQRELELRIVPIIF